MVIFRILVSSGCSQDRSTKSLKATSSFAALLIPQSVHRLSLCDTRRGEKEGTGKDQGSMMAFAFHSGRRNKRRQYPSLCLTRAHPGDVCRCIIRRWLDIISSRDEYWCEGRTCRSSSTSNGTLVFWKQATSPPRHCSNPAILVPHNLPDCIPPRRRIILLVLSLSIFS